MSTPSRSLGEKARALAIATASLEVIRRGLFPEHYRVRAERCEACICVTFTSREAPEGGRGAAGEHPAVEVEIDPEKMQVARFSFVR